MKTTATILKELQVQYNVFTNVKPSKTRTFMTLSREKLSENFSARGIYETYSMEYPKFMDSHYFNINSEFNAVALYTEEKVNDLIEALRAITLANPDMIELAKDEVKKQMSAVPEFTPTPAAVAEEPATDPAQPLAIATPEQPAPAPTQAEPTALPLQPVGQVTKANYGLGFNLDAVMHNAAVEFLMSEKTGILSDIEGKIKTQLLKNTIIVLPNADGSKRRTVVKGRLHKMFKEVLEVTEIEKQSFLSGKAGTGKTSLAAQVAEALGLKFAHISCTAGMSEAHLLGRMIADGSYISSNFVDLYENGGVFLADEVDASDANTLLILNSALANGYISVPNRASNPTAKRHKDFYMICAANTFGNGSNEYAGREILDAAFMDRFAASKIEIDYDTDLELEICENYADIAKKIHQVRMSVEQHKMRRVVSTRVFAAAARSLDAGRTPEQFFERFFTGWSPEEVRKATNQ